MDTQSSAHEIDLEPGGDWAYALDFEEDDDFEDESASASFGSLTNLRVGKPKKKPVLELDPEEAEKAFQQFEMSGAQLLEGAEEHSDASIPAFLGLDPIDGANVDEDEFADEEAAESYDFASVEEDEEHSEPVEPIGLDAMLGLTPQDPVQSDTPDEQEPVAVDDPAEDFVDWDEQQDDLSAEDSELDQPQLPGDVDWADFDDDPSQQDDRPDEADIGWFPRTTSKPSEDLMDEQRPFEQFAAQTTPGPSEEHDYEQANDQDAGSDVEWPEPEWPDADEPEVLQSEELAPAENEVLARMVRPAQHSSVRARLLREAKQRKSIWQHIGAAIIWLARLVTSRRG